MRIECPRCGKVHIVDREHDSVDCTCHLYCSSGSKPSDCSTTLVSLNHEVGWPYGMHVDGGSEDSGDDVLHRVRYCSTHSKYINKVQITIPVNWAYILSRRAPKKHRMVENV